jgi:flagellar basal-body rod protein FlgB
MIGAIQGTATQLAKLALDAAALRHQAIAHNIANLHSEGYVPQGVSFDAQLAARRGAQAPKPALVEEAWRGAGPRPAEVDREMLALSQNTIHYQALVRAYSRQLSILSSAIGEGRRS